MKKSWLAGGSLLAILLAIPLFIILLQLFSGNSETWTHIRQTVLADYLYNTFALMLGVGLLTATIGLSTAWIISTCSFKGRSFLEWALILPLSIPTYIVAFAYAGIFDYTGFIQRFSRNVMGWPTDALVPFEIMSLPGAIIVLSLVLYPYVYLLARASFRLQSRSLLEASWLLGKGNTSTFFKIALPVVRPAIAGGVSLVIMEVLNDYGAVKYYGVSTFTTGIFRAWFSLGDLNAAVRLAAMLLAFVLILLFVERISRRWQLYSQPVKTRPLLRQSLNTRSMILAAGWCWLVFLLGFGIPLLQLIRWAILGMKNLYADTFFTTIQNTFIIAGSVALLATIIALVLSYAGRLYKSGWLNSLTRLATVGYAVPGAVIAIGVMITFRYLNILNDQLLLSGTLAGIIYACVVRFMAVGYNSVDAGLSKISDQLLQASRLMGASEGRTLGRIVLPLLKRSLVAAVILVFVDVMKELPLTLILRPFNFDTLATRTFELAMDEELEQSAVYALSIIAISLPPVVLLNRLFERRRESE